MPRVGQTEMNSASSARAALEPAAAGESLDEANRAGMGEIKRTPQIIDRHLRVGGDRDKRRRSRAGDADLGFGRGMDRVAYCKCPRADHVVRAFTIPCDMHDSYYVSSRSAEDGLAVSAAPIVLALLSAVGYGAGDFLGGQGSRHTSPAQLSLIVQTTALFIAAAAVGITAHGLPPSRVIGWGALAGVGSALGNQALYRGLTRGAMNVVAPLSAVTTAALPAVVGLAGGDQLGPGGSAGLVMAIPAIALISRSPEVAFAEHANARPQDHNGARRATSHLVRRGAGWGLLAGCGFGLLFVGLDQAGTRYGAWPLLLDAGLAVGLVSLVNAGTRRPASRSTSRPPWSRALRWGLTSGACGSAGTILFFLAPPEEHSPWSPFSARCTRRSRFCSPPSSCENAPDGFRSPA